MRWISQQPVRFHFYSLVLFIQLPTSFLQGDLLGKYYVEKFVGEETRAVAAEVISDVRNSFMANLDSVTWMDEDTKKKTEQKLAAITSKLLHPDKWTDFSSVQLSREQSISLDEHFFTKILTTVCSGLLV